MMKTFWNMNFQINAFNLQILHDQFDITAGSFFVIEPPIFLTVSGLENFIFDTRNHFFLWFLGRKRDYHLHHVVYSNGSLRRSLSKHERKRWSHLTIWITIWKANERPLSMHSLVYFINSAFIAPCHNYFYENLNKTLMQISLFCFI